MWIENMEQEIGTWDSVLLEHLSEDNFISNIHQRYKRDHIYTYIGTSIVAVNPFKPLSLYSQELVKAYGSKGIFQLPPHIYGLANLAYQSLKDQSEDQCIILSGESSSGKTESSKLVIHFLTQIQDGKRQKARCHFIKRRNSNSYTSAACSRSSSRPSTPIRQSPVLYMPAEKHGCLVKARSESSDRSGIQRKLSREKMVDFDFSHHKSSENIPHPVVVQSAVKSCFKNNHVDVIGRSKTLANVDYCVRKSNCDLTKNLSTNRINDDTQSHILHTKINTCGTKNYQKNSLSQQNKASLPQYNTVCRQGNNIKCHTEENTDINDDGCNSLLMCCSGTVQPNTKINKCDNNRDIYSNSNRRLASNNCNLSISNSENSKTYSRHSSPDSQRITSNIERMTNTLTDCAVSAQVQKLRDRVACSDVFLDAMGNAMTTKNNNSSRFGKFFDIQIDFKGDPIGIHITHYMLEKTRVTNPNTGERNFHIFYQLLLGADIQFLKSLKLYRNIDKYELLKNTTAIENDKNNFIYTKKSLETLGFSSEEITSVFRVIAVVLKLGNFIFIPVTNIDGTEGCHISNDYELQETAQLLNMDAQILLHCLTRATSPWLHDDNGSELDARQASGARNVLCRTLYARLFTWIINRINESLRSTQREKNLALLDFYGFEILETNSFEQLAINYCNEKLHQNFLQNVLKAEQDIYVREGLEWAKIDFFDNETICELIDKPNYGILSSLNEPHINSDETLLARIQQCCAGHPNFLNTGSAMTSMCFKIRHFAGVVNYSSVGFLEKNSDTLPKSISSGLFQSKLSLVQSLFPEGNPKRLSKKPTSLSLNLRTQLQTLLSIVKSRRNHYVFCIKPNENKQSRTFELALVQHQVRYMSLMPLVNLCRTGHCFHILHSKFFSRYKLLNNLTWPHLNHGKTIDGIALIIRSVPLPAAEFTIGTRNIFIRSPRTVYELEEFRRARLDDLAILIQKSFRMYIRRKRFLQMKKSQIVIASAWRTWRECRFGIPFTGRRHLWSLYKIAREEYRALKYRKQIDWAVQVIHRQYIRWKIRHFLLTLPLRLPPNSLSPLSMEWPSSPKFLAETSRLLRNIYHKWRCYKYRKLFDQTSRNRMREKVTASIIFKDRKASYSRSVAHPFIGDYVRLRQNLQWKKYSVESNDQYVVFADIINKIARSSGKFVPILLVLSTTAMLLLDQRTLQIKYRVPATEIYRLSLSPYLDDVAVFHVRADHSCAREHQCTDSPTGCLLQSELGRKKGDFVFQTGHVIEIVTKLFLVIQNATAKPPEVHISTEFEANFGQQTVVFTFKCSGLSEMTHGQPRVIRRGNRMEIVV